MSISNPDRAHSRSLDRGYADNGIFKSDALAWRCVCCIRACKEQIRCRLRPVQCRFGNKNESISNPQSVKDQRRVSTGGCNCSLHASVLDIFQNCQNARKQIIRCQMSNCIQIECVFPLRQGGNFQFCQLKLAMCQNCPQRTNTIYPFQLLIEGFVEIYSQFIGNSFPGSKMQLRGVCKNAIEIKNRKCSRTHDNARSMLSPTERDSVSSLWRNCNFVPASSVYRTTFSSIVSCKRQP